MTETPSDTPTVQALHEVLDAAKKELHQAEQTAATVPRLRKEIKALEKALGAMSSSPAPRRKSGPTIKDAIFEALEASGGRISFTPGQMLATVHGLTGGKRNSVQVEIHRLDKSGRIIIERNAEGRPVAIKLAPAQLKAVPSVDARERLEG